MPTRILWTKIYKIYIYTINIVEQAIHFIALSILRKRLKIMFYKEGKTLIPNFYEFLGNIFDFNIMICCY